MSVASRAVTEPREEATDKGESPQVLVAEDDPVSRRMVESLLRKWHYDVLTVADGQDGWRALRAQDGPRLALLDWMLPGVEGIEICRMLRQDGSRPYIYILLLTAMSLKKNLVTALEAGADDYLVKPFDAAELRARLHVGRRILKAQDELIAAREALLFQATHDPLTGLWNHGEVLRVLEQELARAGRARHSVAVFMIDLDHFKTINDRYGHVAGDAVLCEVSHRLTDCVRPYDSVGRYGGEEFLVVVPDIDGEAAGDLACRIQESIAKRPLVSVGGPIMVTASIGVAVNQVGVWRSPMGMVRAADIALYRAKERGRNRVELCSTEEPLLNAASAG